ncbi:MAG: hypothetical protein C5B50_25590 [Verrucomicrobia bacterium]|nr:MAG: hypothetical protein C5B50_25590 [Verrucomicrobiota bacterium]
MKTARNRAKAQGWPPSVRQRMRQAIYSFHVRAFGEELARVNFLPRAKRRQYVGEMVDHALRKGVKFEKPALGVTL